ncbi:MAG: hypothetical protein HYY03_02820 [Chloroflexi bacterium]|nr:hypothetical protein [Chloroflexota bacterium]
MRRRVIASLFAAALLVAVAVPVFGGVASANHPPGPPDKVAVCHKGKTLTLPHQAADQHVAQHGDTLGACP